MDNKKYICRDVKKEQYKAIIQELWKYISGKNLHVEVQKN